MGPFKRIIYANNVEEFINSWYSDHSGFVASSYPWFVRGGYYNNGVEAGVFAFSRAYGFVFSYVGFRVVLSFF